MILAPRRVVLMAAMALLFVTRAASAQQYPVMDMVADQIIQKYQTATCQQLWQHKGKPKTQREKEAIQLLHDDAQMRQAFINKVAAPIANKMFECGMIP